MELFRSCSHTGSTEQGMSSLDRRIRVTVDGTGATQQAIADSAIDETLWCEVLGDQLDVGSVPGTDGTVSSVNARVLYRVRWVQWLADARAASVQVSDRLGNLVDLARIRDDTKRGRRRFLILEGEAYP